ncbi:MAG: ferrous iron transport protein A [Clostridia bacterium]|nr:ferrous iron transport protein A [Clostridia bacterium]
MENGKVSREGRMTLDALPKGMAGRIESVNAEGETGLRLTELGYFPGERVEKVLESPLGDPCAYRVRGTVVSLRKTDAERITVRTGGWEE